MPAGDATVRVILKSCPPLDADEQAITRAAYRALADGVPVSIDRIVRSAGVSEQAVRGMVARWPGLAQFDGQQLIGFNGLGLTATHHQVVIAGQVLYAWCAWDSLLILRILGSQARITSRCPVTGRAIRLFVTPGGIADADPRRAMMSFVGVCDRGVAGGLVGVCCELVHFVSSVDAGETWLSAHPAAGIMSLEEAWDLARTFVSARFVTPAGRPS